MKKYFFIGIVSIFFFSCAGSSKYSLTPEAQHIYNKLPEYKGTEKVILLENTPYQTPAFIFDSGKPGVVILITGGTHGDEPADIEQCRLVGG